MISLGESLVAIAAFAAVGVAGFQAKLTSDSVKVAAEQTALAQVSLELAAQNVARQSLLGSCVGYTSAETRYLALRRDYDIRRSAGEPGLRQGPLGTYRYFSDANYEGMGDKGEAEIIQSRFILDNRINEMTLYGIDIVDSAAAQVRELWAQKYDNADGLFLSELAKEALEPIRLACRNYFLVRGNN